MRRHCVLVLAIAALIAIVDAQRSKPGAKALARSTILDCLNSPTTRLLRAHKTATNDTKYNEDNHDEERGGDIPAVEKLTSSLKSTVTNHQLDNWLKKGESADDVFKLPTLDKAADELLANPQLNAWISYIKIFNKENLGKRTSLIATLTAHYGDEGLAKIIEAAKQVPATAGIAKRVQSEQLQRWLAIGRSPDDVFAMMKLDDAGPQVFAHPEFMTWTKYLDDFNTAYEDKQTTLFLALKKHYDDNALVQILIAAKKASSTEKMAIQVQAEQTKLWLHDRKSPSDVFTLLQLDKEGLTLFKSPLFNAWIRYTDDFREIYFGTKLTTIAALKKYYSDDVLTKMILAASKSPSSANIAKRLYAEQFRNWFINKMPPEHVFLTLKLDKAGDKLFESALFTAWMKYMIHYSDANPRKNVNLLTTLTTVLGDRELAKIILAGKNAPSTKKIATELQSAQLYSWLSAKKDPVEVFYLLGVEGTAANDVTRLIYKKYLGAYSHRSKA